MTLEERYSNEVTKILTRNFERMGSKAGKIFEAHDDKLMALIMDMQKFETFLLKLKAEDEEKLGAEEAAKLGKNLAIMIVDAGCMVDMIPDPDDMLTLLKAFFVGIGCKGKDVDRIIEIAMEVTNQQ